MKTSVRCIACALIAAVPGMAGAQQTLIAVEKPTTVTNGSFLPSNTEVWLSMNQELSSKGIKHGQMFDLTVARDVMVGNYVVIPRGARGHGQISWRTGKGAFGKSAKMEFDLVDVDIGGSLVPLSGHYRIEGRGNTGAAVGAVVAAGVFGAFVTGRSAVAAQGTEWKAFTREPLPILMASAAPASAAPATAAVPVAAPAPVAAMAPVAERVVAPVAQRAVASAAVQPAPARQAVALASPEPAPAAVSPRVMTPYQLGRLQGQQAIATAQAQTGGR